MDKRSVYVIGATGEAGSSIVNGLIEFGKFHIIAGIRPSSLEKPEFTALDLVELKPVTETLQGVDTVISAIFVLQLHLQKPLVDACKKAGVRRVIPCDWGPACVRRVRKMFDTKLDIQDYIKKSGVSYTFIDVGWWMQCLLPYPDPSLAYTTSILDHTAYRFGSADKKCAIIDARDIGKFVARIIVDDRTLNHYVFCWTEEVTQNEALALAQGVSGRKFDLPHLTTEEVIRKYKEPSDAMDTIHHEYWYSLWVRGDNTVENAKRLEYGVALDARELYPELDKKLRRLEDYTRDLHPDILRPRIQMSD